MEGNSSSKNGTSALLAEGQRFGSDLIIRLLGKGGMAEVYEADHLESGHRVALRILGQSLSTSVDRERFLREGRLAASINHPHSVYIYGTEEVDGTPVISMELVRGGTLKDHVKAGGPAPPSEAADITLQLISGLEAAEAAGILHRDIKPSNCFGDYAEGVKIGDFGLSISTAARDETHLTAHGTFLGTPAFASPEQLQGEELDVRSDIYSVGATLHFLLSGKAPFEEEGAVKLIARILKEDPESPRTLRPEIPKGLAIVVLRCLAKDRAARYGGYAELTRELLPFSSVTPGVADLRTRFLAGVIDHLIWGFPSSVIGFYAGFSEAFTRSSFATTSSRQVLHSLVLEAAVVAYFGVLEGIWGASVGKAIFGLRVVGPDRNIPGLPRAFLRVFVYSGITALVELALQRNTSSSLAKSLELLLGVLLWLIVFSTARRRNGFAGLHDLASKTRVVVRASRAARPAIHAVEEAPAASAALRYLGPYAVVRSLWETETGALFLGYDPRLRRSVWIRTLPTGSHPVSLLRRDLSRAARLRWLNGKRTPEESWDAYEALTGRALLDVLSEKQPWGRVRFWLLDLAEEFDAGMKDHSLPPVLSLDQIWITSDGRAKLLEFRSPGIGISKASDEKPPSHAADLPGIQALMLQVASSALEGHAPASGEGSGRLSGVLLPHHARSFLSNLGMQTFQSSQAIIQDLQLFITSRVVVSRRKRALHLAMCAFLPFVFSCGVLGGVYYSYSEVSNHSDLELWFCLQRLESLQAKCAAGDSNAVGECQALEIYISGHFDRIISEPSRWPSGIPQPLRNLALSAMKNHPKPGFLELRSNQTEMDPFVSKLPRANTTQPSSLVLVGVVLVGLMLILLIFGVLGVFSAPTFRGGALLSLLGIVVVTRGGSQASRLRCLCRSLVAWSPVFLVVVLEGTIVVSRLRSAPFREVVLRLVADPFHMGALAAGIALLLAGAVWAILTPERGPQDRIAGTFLVPR